MCDTEIFYSHDYICRKGPEQKPLVLRRNTLNKRKYLQQRRVYFYLLAARYQLLPVLNLLSCININEKKVQSMINILDKQCILLRSKRPPLLPVLNAVYISTSLPHPKFCSPWDILKVVRQLQITVKLWLPWIHLALNVWFDFCWLLFDLSRNHLMC